MVASISLKRLSPLGCAAASARAAFALVSALTTDIAPSSHGGGSAGAAARPHTPKGSISHVILAQLRHVILVRLRHAVAVLRGHAAHRILRQGRDREAGVDARVGRDDRA